MSGAANHLIGHKKLNEVNALVRAMAHPLRIKIINFIDSQGKINVNKIYRALKIEQSIASQHLRILRDVKLVLATRDGKFIYYTVNYGRVEQVANALHNFFDE
jgi:ArsR family transcriptional regulator